MFKTEDELNEYMKANGLYRDENGLIGDEDGFVNPYILNILINDHWQPRMGCMMTESEAFSELESYIKMHPDDIILMERCNDLESYSYIYQPCTGISLYSDALVSLPWLATIT